MTLVNIDSQLYLYWNGSYRILKNLIEIYIDIGV